MTVFDDKDNAKEVPSAPKGSGVCNVIVDFPREGPKVYPFTCPAAADRFIVEWIEEGENSPLSELSRENEEFFRDYMSCETDFDKVNAYLSELWESNLCGELVEFRVDAREVME